jgi:anti-sigma-K factor RskA
VSKKRKKKQAAKQAPRPAQAKGVQERDTKPKIGTKSKTKSAAPAGKARRWVWPAVFALVIVAALVIAQALVRQSAARPSGPWTLTILHTTDVEGYLDPCG